MQVGMFQVLLLQRMPERAYRVLKPLEPFIPFRDPSMGTSLFDLTVYHCLCVSPHQYPTGNHRSFTHLDLSDNAAASSCTNLAAGTSRESIP